MNMVTVITWLYFYRISSYGSSGWTNSCGGGGGVMHNHWINSLQVVDNDCVTVYLAYISGLHW